MFTANQQEKPDQSIAERVRFIYGKSREAELTQRIESLIRRYQERFGASHAAYRLSEKDVVLITYGDSLLQEGAAHLRVLERFVDDWVDGLINTVHILPFHPFTSDDGFSVCDYYKVREDLGDWADLLHMAERYRLMYDAVVNHASQRSTWFEAFLNGDPQYKDFFLECDPHTDLSAVVRPRTSPLLHPYTDQHGVTKYLWTTFSEDQVDLNYGNPEVLLAILDVLLNFVAQGARVLRLDAVTFIWKEIGTNCVHLERTHAILKLMRQVMDRVCPDVTLITETNVPHAENVSYFGNGHDEAHMVYNFALPPLVAYSILSGNAQALTRWADDLKLPSNDVCFFNFTASHDGVGVRAAEGLLSASELDLLIERAKNHGGYVSYRSGADGKQSPYELNCSYIDLLTAPEEPDDLRLKRFLASQAIALAMPGVPAIYIHSLIGSRNENALVEKTGRYRSINRAQVDYRQLCNDLQGDGFRKETLNALKRLIAARIKCKQLAPYARFRAHKWDRRLFVLERFIEENAASLITIVNVSSDAVSVTLPCKLAVRDVLSSRLYPAGELVIEPYGFVWLEAVG